VGLSASLCASTISAGFHAAAARQQPTSRSWKGGVFETRVRTDALGEAPYSPQNFEIGALSAPHWGQRRGSPIPHSEQNLLSAGFSEPQFEQRLRFPINTCELFFCITQRPTMMPGSRSQYVLLPYTASKWFGDSRLEGLFHAASTRSVHGSCNPGFPLIERYFFLIHEKRRDWLAEMITRKLLGGLPKAMGNRRRSRRKIEENGATYIRS
jgi:hypothetical protein